MNDILLELEENKVFLSLDGEDLLINFEGENLNPDILKKLKENKPSLVSYLQKYNKEDIYHEIPKLSHLEKYKLSSSQYRMWVLGQSEKISRAYHVQNTEYFNLDLNIDAFQKAIDRAIQRHESLRTVFKFNSEENQVFQKIIPISDFNYTLPRIDIREKENKEDWLKEYIEKDNKKTFDFEEGPLFRMYLFHVKDEEYVFYYNMHHIISDTWSLGILTRDVIAYYESFIKNEPHKLPELNIQYKDFAAWSNDQEKNPIFKKDKVFWTSLFKEPNLRLDLPSNKIRPKVNDYKGICLQTYISDQSTQGLRALCKKRNISLFMGLVAIWKILFYKYTGIKDITVGTIVAGRDHLDLKDQIGCFINTLALRNYIDPNDSCEELIQKVGESTLIAFEHQMFPFNLLIEELGLTTEVSRGTLFDILIQLQNSIENESSAFEGIDFDTINSRGEKSATSDLVIDFVEKGDCLDMTVTFKTGTYEEEMVTGLIRHFKHLLSEILKNPKAKIAKINCLPEDEIQNIFGFNKVMDRTTKFSTVLEAFDKYVKKQPNEIAIKTNKLEISYAELDEQSNKLANYLRQNYNLESEDLVGVMLDRNEDQIISILGVLKSGAAYVPIDLNCPEERVRYILEETKCKLCIDGNEIHKYKTSKNVTLENIKIDPSSLVYVIYTSGSTGRPKGVMIGHDNLLDHLITKSEYFEIEEKENFILFASTSFDASVDQIFLSLFNGGTLYIPTKEEIIDVNRFQQILQEHAINHLPAVPSFLQKIKRTSSTSIKRIVSGGDFFIPEIAKEWVGYTKVYNQYGPTEATIGATTHLINDSDTDRFPIGKPLVNNRCYILGPNTEVQPIGVVGEIFIGGKGVARGYFGNPELTATKFVSNPFVKGEKMYATGDIGKWLSDGNILFEGRVDHQIKINGYRVELQEIQNQIEKKGSIQKARVIVKNNQGNNELVAYIISEKKEELEEIRKFIAKRLPDYMIPVRFVQMNTFPLNSNGKIDIKKLSEQEEGIELKADIEFQKPKTEKERILATIWAHVLRRERVSRKDNFYYLGGDSIKLIQVIAKLRQEGWRIKVEHVIQFPVLEECALHLTENLRFIDQKPIVGRVALTPIQRAFFTNPLIVNKNYYNQSVVLKSKHKIDTEVLQYSIDEIINHHDALRIVFSKNNNDIIGYTKVFDNSIPCEVKFIDLSDVVNVKEEIQKYGEENQSSFNIAKGPLLKVIHFHLDTEDLIVIIIHHLVVDGISWRIILEDLANIYKNKNENKEYQLPLKTDSYQRWALELQKYSGSVILGNEKKYWENICSKFSSNALSKRFKNFQSLPMGNTDYFSLDEKQTKSLLTLVPKAFKTEINEVLLSALGEAIWKSFGVTDTFLKVEGHGREDIIDHLDIGRTVGWFTSFFPFLLKVSNTKSSVENLLSVQEDMRRIPNKGIGYGILRYLSNNPSLEIEPSIEFNYLGDFGNNVESNESESIFEYGSENVGRSSENNNGNGIVISIQGMVVHNKLEMTINYVPGSIETDEIVQLTQSYKKCLTNLIEVLGLHSQEQTQFEIGHFWNNGDSVALSYNQKYILNSRQTQLEIGPIEIPNYSTIENFKKKFRTFINYHKVLSVEYYKKDREVYQRIKDPDLLKIKFEEIYTSNLDLRTQDLMEQLRQPFDVFQGELIRVNIFIDKSSNKTYAYFCIYHALLDGFTGKILEDDLLLFLDNKKIQQDYVTNFDFSVWQQQYLQTKEAFLQKQIFIDKLKQIDLKKSKTLKRKSVECLSQRYTIHGSGLNFIKKTCSESGLSLSSFFMGMHQEWIAHFCKNKMIQLAIADGREQEIKEFEGKTILGIMNNYIPMIIGSISNKTITEHLSAVYQDYLNSRLIQQIPFGLLREELWKNDGVDLENYVGGTFNFQVFNSNKRNENFISTAITEKDVNDFTKGLDLTLMVYNNAIDIKLSHDIKLFKESFKIEGLIQNFINKLKK